MKILLTNLLCFLIIGLNAQTAVSGKVTDRETGEELIGANISFKKGGDFITGVATDFDGNYKVNIDPGTYDVLTSYIGLPDKEILGVVVKASQTTFLNIEMSSGDGGINIDEIIVTDYKVPLIDKDNTTSGSTISFSSRMPSRSIKSFASKRATPVGVIKTKKKKERAGQLTAGEWKDLDNWTFWKKLLKNKHFSKNQKHWGYQTSDRFSVKLSDEKGRPTANVQVNLMNSRDEIVWAARTDNNGGAELWGNFFGGEKSIFNLQIVEGEEVWHYPAIPYADGINSIVLPLTCESKKKVQVAFIIDATGSMNDEIQYLKAEIRDVLEQVKESEEIDLESGAVFYTDRKYQDPVYSSPLSTDINPTIDFLQNPKPKIGTNSEIPEAVDLGLDMGINELKWDEEALTRIIFLILDAPPHNNKEYLEDIEKNIKLAAKKGIKIIPVAASGVDKKTEFLLKFFAMATNGTYTFLTDHSGIGNSHIAPEAKDYNIETLNDLLIRLILENAEYHECGAKGKVEELIENKKITKKTRKKKSNKPFFKLVKTFPNPADDFLFVETKEQLELLLIVSADSKIMGQFPGLDAGQIKIKTTDWAAGVYFLNFYHKGKHIVKKIIVTH